MTTRSAKLYQGEDKTPVHDYTDLVIWEESEFGTRAWQGEGSASTVVIRDPLGEQGNELLLPAGLSRKSLAAKNLFVVEVDSSTLFRGRVGIKNYSRDNQRIERYRQVECSLHDTNWDLDHIFVHQYSRPLETDKARAQGLIASYLSTSPRTTTALNGSNYISGSNLVTLPAQTYNRTSPLGVLREIAGTANKQFFVTGDAIGGGSLFYDGNDSTAYACTFTISDRESEVRAAPTTTFPPIWNVGPASTEDGSELASHLRLFFGVDEDSYVTASSAVVQNQYSHASETITDDTVTDAANAQTKANARLAHRQYEDKNYNVTIGPLTDAQVVLVKHGMTINIKARAIPDADDQLRLMRIVQCRYTTPIAGTWFAHLQLGRPWKMAPYGTGPVLVPTTVPYTCVPGPDPAGGCRDNFDRTEGSGWGTSGIMCLDWNSSANGTHSVDGSAGVQTVTVAANPTADWLDFEDWNGDPVEFMAKIRIDANFRHRAFSIFQASGTAAYGPISISLAASFTWDIRLETDGDVSFFARAAPGGAAWIEDGDTLVAGATAADWIRLRGELTSTQISMKVWMDGTSEPAYQAVATAPGGIDLLEWLLDGSGNPGTPCNVFGYFSADHATDLGTNEVELIEFTSGMDCSGQGCVIACPAPAFGQPVQNWEVGMGNGVGTLFTLPLDGGYTPGSLLVWVDGLLQNVAATDPTAGTFTLDFAPTSEELVTASWRAP